MGLNTGLAMLVVRRCWFSVIVGWSIAGGYSGVIFSDKDPAFCERMSGYCRLSINPGLSVILPAFRRLKSNKSCKKAASLCRDLESCALKILRLGKRVSE